MANLYKAKKLLDKSDESFYWLGFIMADGYIEDNRVSFSLSAKDRDQLKKLKKFLDIDNIIFDRKKVGGYKEGKFSSFVVSDSDTMKKIKENFSLDKAKTYNPPVLPKMSKSQFIGFLCGYIDGDGCISKQTGRKYTNKKGITKQYKRSDYLMQVKSHNSWEPILNELGERLCKIFRYDTNTSKIRVDSKGYAVWRIYNTKLLQDLKNKAQELKIPLMSRKWSKVI